MKKEDVKKLLLHYQSMKSEGQTPYFDTDQLESLLTHLEQVNNDSLYKEVLALGLRLHPDDSYLRLKKSVCLVQDRAFDEALQLLDLLSEEDDEANSIRAKCLVALGRYEELAQIADSIEVEDDEGLILYPALVADDEEQAQLRAYYREKCERNPQKRLTYKRELYSLLEKLGRLDEAIEVCNEVIDEQPYSFDDWVMLAGFYQTKLCFDKAIESYEFALTCNDRDEYVYHMYGYCLYRNLNYQKAIDVFGELLERTKNRELIDDIIPILSNCYVKIKEFDTAFEILYQIYEHEPQKLSSESFVDLIISSINLDYTDELQKVLCTALKRFPDHLLFAIYDVLTRLDKGKEAEIDQALARLAQLLVSDHVIINQADVVLLLQMVDIFVTMRRYEKSIFILLKIEKVFPDLPFINVLMAVAYKIFMHDNENAVKYLSRCSHDEILEYMSRSKNNIFNVNAINPEGETKF